MGAGRSKERAVGAGRSKEGEDRRWRFQALAGRGGRTVAREETEQAAANEQLGSNSAK